MVYLQCSVDQQYERTHRDRNRPLIQTDNPKSRLQELMDHRDPLYREVADFIVSTESRNASAVVNDILDHLGP